MAAASSADDEAMNTFNQLKRKVLTSRSALNQNAEQQRTAEMQIMKVKLSLQQISGLEDATRCYKCVGKAYISTQRGAVIDQMEATLERLVQGVEGHKATKARLEGNITSAEGEMKDFLQSNEALGRQYLASSAS